MSLTFRYGALLMLVVLAACSREEREPVIEEPDYTEPTVIDTDRLDAFDYADPRNLDNPQSLLAERVIYFEFDRSEVLPRYREVLAAHGAFLRANPDYAASLEGHADERGTREYNLALSERRGNSVRDLLNVQGAATRQLNVVAYGEERPVSTCPNESCWSQNRRVEIVYGR